MFWVAITLYKQQIFELHAFSSKKMKQEGQIEPNGTKDQQQIIQMISKTHQVHPIKKD